jgi:outer membrane lipoprotein-sorting protein
MTRRLTLALLLTASFAFAEDPPAAAAPAPAPAPAAVKLSPQEVLAKMDAAINGFSDQTMEVKLTVIDTDSSKKSYDMTVFQKGEKRMIQFTSGEMKGMSTLVEDRSSVHVYLPGFKKVRRVAAHNMNQSMAGSDLTSEDMANVSWLDWNVALEKEDDTSWFLALTPKGDSEYAKIVHRVSKKNFGQAESHYFNKAGEEVKRFMNSDLTEFHGAYRYKSIVVSDPRTGHRTELEVKDFKVNQGLKDDLFTVRQLQWGK